MNKIREIDKRLHALKILWAELGALAQACDGDDRPNCPNHRRDCKKTMLDILQLILQCWHFCDS